MSIISLSSQEDLKAWTLCAWLFWPAILVLWQSVSSGKNVLDTTIRIAAGIVLEITIVVIAIFYMKIEPNLLEKIYAGNLVYIDIVAWAGLIIIMGMDSTWTSYDKCWSLPFLVVLGLYFILRSRDFLKFTIVDQLELNDAHKFRWLLMNFFILAPITWAATFINLYVLVHLRENEKKMVSVLPSQSLEAEAQQTITFPIDEIFIAEEL